MFGIEIPFIPASHWQLAKRLLTNDGDKLRRTVDNRFKGGRKKAGRSRVAYYDESMSHSIVLQHSFIRVEGRIYAIINGGYIGSGSFNKAKFCIDDKERLYVIRIRDELKILKSHNGQQYLEIIKFESIISRDLGIYIGEASRTDNLQRKDVRKKVNILPYLGLNLYCFFFEMPDKLLDYTLCETAFDCMQALRALHKNKKIIHCDVALENFLIDRYGSVSIIDFGYARYADSHGQVKHKIALGRLINQAPEVKQYHCHSTASDVYALGKSFEKLLAMRHDQFANKMKSRFKPTKLTIKLKKLVRTMLMAKPESRASLKYLEIALLTCLYKKNTDLFKALAQYQCEVRSVIEAKLITHYLLAKYDVYGDEEIINYTKYTKRAILAFQAFFSHLPRYHKQRFNMLFLAYPKLKSHLIQCFRIDYCQHAAMLLAQYLLTMMPTNKKSALFIADTLSTRSKKTAFILITEVIASHYYHLDYLLFDQRYDCTFEDKRRLKALGLLIKYTSCFEDFNDNDIISISQNAEQQYAILLVNWLKPKLLSLKLNWTSLISCRFLCTGLMEIYHYLNQAKTDFPLRFFNKIKKSSTMFINKLVGMPMLYPIQYRLHREISRELALWRKACQSLLVDYHGYLEKVRDQEKETITDVVTDNPKPNAFRS